jgi:hypothetical protein
MITNFFDFCQFSAKKWRFSQKHCFDQIFATTNSSFRKQKHVQKFITSVLHNVRAELYYLILNNLRASAYPVII